MSLERLNILLEKIKDIKEENRVLRAEILELKNQDIKVPKVNKKKKKHNKKDITPSLF